MIDPKWVGSGTCRLVAIGPPEINPDAPAADTGKVTNEQRTLKQLILEGMYPVDEHSVARAIVARAGARDAVARAGFHSDVKGSSIALFRPYPPARAFRLGRNGGAPHSAS